jgi:hypothetical protein
LDQWRRNSTHLHGSHRACFTIPRPKPDMRVSSSSGFPSLQTKGHHMSACVHAPWWQSDLGFG